MSLQIAPETSSKWKFNLKNGDTVTLEHYNKSPYAFLSRWNDECYIAFPVPLLQVQNCALVNNRLIWENQAFKISLYPVDQDDFGALEFEVVLKRKPASNVFSLPIQTQGLTFYYQPPLTAEEIADGAVRPDHVVGSYAVYHAIRSNAHASKADGEKYRCGKAFHIYRPKLTDALGSTTWATLNIADGQLTITLPQAFLNSTTYPVTIDPTFGYSTAGGASTAITANYVAGSLFTSPSDASTANNIIAYIDDASIPETFIKGLIINHNDLTIISNGVGTPVQSYYNNPDWKTSPLTSNPTISPSTEYILGIIVDTYLSKFYYDDGDTNQHHIDSTNSYSSPQDLGTAVHGSRKFSIYCTYTASGGFTKTFTANAELQGTLTKTLTANANLLQNLTKTFTANAELTLTSTKTLTVNAELQGTLTKTFTANSELQATLTKTFSFNAELELPTLTKGFTANAQLQQTITKTFTTNAELLQQQTKTFTVNAELAAVAITKGFTVNANLQGTLTKTFTLNSELQVYGAPPSLPSGAGIPLIKEEVLPIEILQLLREYLQLKQLKVSDET